MENQMMNSMYGPMEHAMMMERMYPDSVMKVKPCVRMKVDSMGDDEMYGMTHENLDRIAEEIMRNCNVHEDMPMGHNIQTMTDITKTLLIREMYDRHTRMQTSVTGMDDSVPAFAPFSLFPFFFYPFDHYDDYHRHNRHHRHWDGRYGY